MTRKTDTPVMDDRPLSKRLRGRPGKTAVPVVIRKTTPPPPVPVKRSRGRPRKQPRSPSPSYLTEATEEMTMAPADEVVMMETEPPRPPPFFYHRMMNLECTWRKVMAQTNLRIGYYYFLWSARTHTRQVRPNPLLVDPATKRVMVPSDPDFKPWVLRRVMDEEGLLRLCEGMPGFGKGRLMHGLFPPDEMSPAPEVTFAADSGGGFYTFDWPHDLARTYLALSVEEYYFTSYYLTMEESVERDRWEVIKKERREAKKGKPVAAAPPVIMDVKKGTGMVSIDD
jgi:hypothetical protein